MPLYDYECRKCGYQFEKVLKISDLSSSCPLCPACGGIAKKVILLGRGGIHRDQPTWLDDASDVLLDESEKPFESRTEWKRHLKENHITPTG